jgi:hypothetical protein
MRRTTSSTLYNLYPWLFNTARVNYNKYYQNFYFIIYFLKLFCNSNMETLAITWGPITFLVDMEHRLNRVQFLVPHHGLHMEVDLQSLIWAPCHVMCTAVLIG